MPRKRSNGEGSISYDSRRKRYRAKITIGWEFDEKTGKSKQIIKSIGSNYKTRGEASKALEEYLNDPYDLDAKNITFSQLYEKWYEYFLQTHESQRYRLKTAYAYCSTLYNKKFKAISILDMKRAINEGTRICAKGKNKGERIKASPQTKESMKYLFNHLYDYALEARICNINYARNFILDKEIFEQKEKEKVSKDPFTEAQLETLWQSKNFIPLVDIIIYACYSGWRPGELISLKIKDVNWEEEYIRGGIKTTAGKNRIVPIHPLVKDIVRKYYDEAISVNSEFLFNDTSKKKGIGLSYDQWLSRFNKIITTLKFEGNLTPHSTRHTFVTKGKRAGMNEYLLKNIIGHKIGDLTEKVYTHREIQELKDEIKKIKS